MKWWSLHLKKKKKVQFDGAATLQSSYQSVFKVAITSALCLSTLGGPFKKYLYLD